jgi:glycerophosphoryl diester phosphodiesterase
MPSIPHFSHPDNFLDGDVPIAVIAHRGASRAEKENTINAFLRARQLGADAVELDVRITADGELVVHHDARLDDERVICATKRKDLPKHIPNLAEALDACDGMWVNIEIKNDPREPDFDATDQVARRLVAHLHDRNTDDRWVISSFRRETIDVMRSFRPSIRTAWLTIGAMNNDAEQISRSLHNAGHYAIHPWEATLTAEQVLAYRQQGLAVNVWTCDDPTRMNEFKQWGVSGICTNVPDVAISALAP